MSYVVPANPFFRTSTHWWLTSGRCSLLCGPVSMRTSQCACSKVIPMENNLCIKCKKTIRLKKKYAQLCNDCYGEFLKWLHEPEPDRLPPAGVINPPRVGTVGSAPMRRFRKWVPRPDEKKVSVKGGPNDYLIRGTQGELYPVKSTVFDDVYESEPRAHPPDPRDLLLEGISNALLGAARQILLHLDGPREAPPPPPLRPEFTVTDGFHEERIGGEEDVEYPGSKFQPQYGGIRGDQLASVPPFPPEGSKISVSRATYYKGTKVSYCPECIQLPQPLFKQFCDVHGWPPAAGEE